MKRIISNALTILTKQERAKLLRFVLLNVGVNLIDILSLMLLVMFINDYTQKSGNTSNDPFPPIAVIFTLFVLKSIVGYQSYVNQYRYVYDVASRISRRNLLQYLEGSYTEYVSVDSSVQVRKILHQPIEFCHYVLTGILRGAAESVLALMTVAALLLFNVKLFLLLTVVLVPPVFVLSWFTKRRLRHARANAKTSGERSLQYLQESLSGYVEGNIFDKKDFFADRYSKYQKEMVRFLADVETAQGLPSRLIEVFAVAGILVIVLWSRLPSNAIGLSMINIGAFMAAAYKIIPGIVKIANLGSQVRTYEYTVYDLLQLNKTSQQKKTKASSLEKVSFQNVHFFHGEQSILNNCNLEIGRGDFIGIHGPSGKGKTTVLNLLLGFLSPQQGEILVNGCVANSSERRAFWQQISYVQQRPFLMHDTIHSNITLEEETNDTVDLDELMEIVGLSELAKRSGNSKNAIITENGKNISGGQRQRIAIARALYKQSGLIILDEPFSELDAFSEKRILAHLKSLTEKGTMIVMVTHKLENLSYCNKVYELS